MRTYDFKRMQTLLRDFHNLTGIKICIYDSAGTELCFYPEKYTDFCKKLREDPVQDALCRACDRHAFAECKKTHKQCVSTCHAGLLECFSPILYGSQLIGYIVIGQIRTSGHTAWDGADERGELPAFYESLPVMSMDKISSAIHILDACAGYEYLKRLVDATENKIETRLETYVNENLAKELSVPRLCSVFHLSKTELYTIFRESFDASVADFIKQRRLNRACELLEKTPLSVGEIAVQCGIPDYNYFSKVFKRAYGKSPSVYRKTRGN